MSVNVFTEEELQRALENLIKDVIKECIEFYFDKRMIPHVLARMLGDSIAMTYDPSEARKDVDKLIDEQIAFRAKTRSSGLKIFSMGYLDHQPRYGEDILERESISNTAKRDALASMSENRKAKIEMK
jgi:hypothetical protein